MSRQLGGLAYGGRSLASYHYATARYCKHCHADMRDVRGLPCEDNPLGTTHEPEGCKPRASIFGVTKSVNPR